MNVVSSNLTLSTPKVTLQNGKAFANSRDVAEFFGKRHDNVLRDVRNMEMPSDLRTCLFQPIILQDKYGRDLDAFNMTKDGFTLLAMGFTGKQALQFKIAYITRFNEMEAVLKAEVTVAPRSTAIGHNEFFQFEFEGMPLRAVASRAQLWLIRNHQFSAVHQFHSHLTDRNSDNEYRHCTALNRK